MWSRRSLILTTIKTFLFLFLSPLPKIWAKVKKILPRGFSREKMKEMNPKEIDNRELEIDPIESFGTMGPTDVTIDIKTYKLKVSGKVFHPLALTYDQIIKLPKITETILLICPGYFAYNAQWTGVDLRTLLQESQVKKEARWVDIHGAYGKVVRIPLKELNQKKILLAYQVNGKNLPKPHGFPLRLVYEDAYGYDWVKYIEELVIS